MLTHPSTLTKIRGNKLIEDLGKFTPKIDHSSALDYFDVKSYFRKKSLVIRQNTNPPFRKSPAERILK